MNGGVKEIGVKGGCGGGPGEETTCCVQEYEEFILSTSLSSSKSYSSYLEGFLVILLLLGLFIWLLMPIHFAFLLHMVKLFFSFVLNI